VELRRRGRDPPADFEQIVCRCSDEGGAAAGAYVFDSDWAVVLAARDGKPAATVVVNEEAARDEGLDVVNQSSAFAEWTAATTPRRLSDDEVHEVLSREWTFAEEAVAELFERAGLPAPYDPLERTELGANVIIGRPPPPPSRATVESIGAEGLGGYEAPVGWMGEQFVLGGDVVSWRDARFVPGVGSNFLGIWDRRSVPEPAAGGEAAVCPRSLLAAKRWIVVTSSVVCSIMKVPSPHSVPNRSPIRLDPERSRFRISPHSVPLESLLVTGGAGSRQGTRIPVATRARWRELDGNSAGSHRGLASPPTRWARRCHASTATACPRGGRYRIASIPHTKARHGLRA
jgi:hypothetical protein